jgi:hypothetical protein
MSMMGDLLAALDPDEFAASVGLELDDWQSRLLVSTSRKVIMLCSRQAGKSTTAALLALHSAIFDAGLVLLVSPSQRQSTELFRKVTDHLRRLPNPPDIASESITRIEFRNGSRIVSLPGSEVSVRGYSAARLVVVDEASRVPDDLMAAVRPILAVAGGRLICLSTPAGRIGWFYNAWTDGVGWERYKVAANDIPRISQEFLDDELRELGPDLFSQEYELAFVDDNSQVFSTELIDRMFSRPDILPLWISTQ